MFDPSCSAVSRDVVFSIFSWVRKLRTAVVRRPYWAGKAPSITLTVPSLVKGRARAGQLFQRGHILPHRHLGQKRLRQGIAQPYQNKPHCRCIKRRGLVFQRIPLGRKRFA